MSTNLQLVNPASQARVLGSETLARLQALGMATRALRALGFQIASQELHPQRGDLPEIVVVPGDGTDMATFKARSGPIYPVKCGDDWYMRADFRGASVIWEQAQ